MATPKSGKYDVHWMTLQAMIKKVESIAIIDLANDCNVSPENEDFKHAVEIISRQPGILKCMGKAKSGLRCVVLSIAINQPTKRDKSNNDYSRADN